MVVKLELEVRRRSLFFLSLCDLGSLSLSLSLSLRKCFEVKIGTENNFRGQSLILYGQMKIISGKLYFQSQPNSLFYGKLIPVFGSFKYFYRKCIKSGKRNQNPAKENESMTSDEQCDERRATSGAIVDRAARRCSAIV